MNKTIFQFFHWYNTPEENLWVKVKDEAERLAQLGITHVWLPPAYKSAKGVDEPGYAVYDLYDLGEFDQKGTVRTKYGTKNEYLEAIDALHQAGLEVLADVVLNHKMGGDEKERVTAIGVKEENRKEVVEEPHAVEVYSKFTFPGRGGKYSSYVWDQHSFSGFCEDGNIKMILNEYTNGEWEEMLEVEENGNYDYLLGMDIEFRNPYVREELKKWGCWYIDQTDVDGFRLDALKHINPTFFPEWISHLENCHKKNFWIIGEYWKNEVTPLKNFIAFTQGKINLFDVPLHFNFHEASNKKADYDMGSILNRTLVKEAPEYAITFVDNHDTQPGQSLESAVDIWFKPLAGAVISLRQEGVTCVSYPALYGASYKEEKEGKEIEVTLDKVEMLPLLLAVRRDFAYGNQRDYFDHKNIVGWTREGIAEMEDSGIAILLSNAGEGEKWMSMGEANKGRKMVNISNTDLPNVELNEKGEGLFKVGSETVSIYVSERARDRMK